MSETDNASRLSNGFDPDVVKGYVDRIERLNDELASEKGEYMERCKVITEQRASVLQEAKDQHGISKRALKTVVKVRGLEEHAERLREELEPESKIPLITSALRSATTPTHRWRCRARESSRSSVGGVRSAHGRQRDPDSGALQSCLRNVRAQSRYSQRGRAPI